MAQLFEAGAIKYKERNWEAGIPTNIYADSGLRHLAKYVLGRRRDEDHLAMAVWNILCLIQTEEWIRTGVLPPELQTLPQPNAVEAGGLKKKSKVVKRVRKLKRFKKVT